MAFCIQDQILTLQQQTKWDTLTYLHQRRRKIAINYISHYVECSTMRAIASCAMDDARYVYVAREELREGMRTHRVCAGVRVCALAGYMKISNVLISVCEGG